jgi:hypothetical protein
VSAQAGEMASRYASLGGRLRPRPRTAAPPRSEDDVSPAPGAGTSAGGSPEVPAAGSRTDAVSYADAVSPVSPAAALSPADALSCADAGPTADAGTAATAATASGAGPTAGAGTAAGAGLTAGAGTTKGVDPAGSGPGAADAVGDVTLRAAAVATAVALNTSAVTVASTWSHRERARLDRRVAELPRTPWGRRGYDEAAVEALLAGVNQDLADADDQIDDLRGEVDRLHRYIRRQWAAVAAAEAAGKPRGRHAVDAPDDDLYRLSAHGRGSAGPEGASPSAQARAVLTQAQEIAERRLAEADARLAEAERLATARLTEAEREADAGARATLADAEAAAAERLAAADEASGHRLARTERMAEKVLLEAEEEARTRKATAVDGARRLLVLARARYEDIIVRAHQRADHAAELALDDLEPIEGQAGTEEHERRELEAKAAYLRTFAKVSRSALQAALDLSGREFDQLLGDEATLEESLATQDRTADGDDADAGDDEGQDAKVIVLPRSDSAESQSRPAAFSAR